MQKGRLFLIPHTLGETAVSDVIPQGVVDIAGNLSVFIVENIRTARRFIRKMHAEKNIDELKFLELNKHTSPEEISEYLNAAEQGLDIGLMSEAGNPGIADPGASVAELAHRKGIRVVPLAGPSSILMALIASGLNGQNFAFNGYLPIDNEERIKKIRHLELRSKTEKQSQIFMETPFRNNQLTETLLKTLQSSTKLCIAADISTDTEFIQTKQVTAWKTSLPDLHKRPTIFILLA